jgi:type I restriction enzyme S subunit
VSELPAGWEWSTLSEACELVQDCEHRTPKFTENGSPALRPRDVVGGRLGLNTAARVSESEYVLQTRRYTPSPGDIAYSRELSLGWAAVVPAAQICLSQGMVVMKPGTGLSPDYLAHFLNGPGRLYALGAQVGSAHPHLNLRDIRAMPVVVAPRSEQERIAAAIDEAFSKLGAGEAGLGNVRQLLKRTRDAVLAAAGTGRLVQRDPTDAPAAKLLVDLGVEAIDPDGVPDLPEGWAWAPLGAVADVVGGVTKDSKRQDDPSFVERPYLRVANVQRGHLDLGSVATIRVPPEKAAKLELRPGDVLFNEGGDRDKLGRGWVWEGRIDGCIHQNHVFRARLAAGIEPKLVSIWGNTFGRSWFEGRGKQTTNLASLNLATLRSFPIPIGPPAEQQRILAEVERQLSFIEACERSVDAGLEVSAVLRQSVLREAFEGRLVPQDPTDEPASVLLERSRAERAATPKGKKRRARTTA